MSAVDIEFLDLEAVLALHAESLAQFGGSAGIRDAGLVASALASAQNVHFYAGGDLYDIAAAYAFHLAESQAFIDGNKRAGMAAALTFLAGNGVPRFVDDGRLYDAMIAIAEKRMDKAALADVFRKLAGSK